jgi:hypothetical protein
MAGNWFPSVTVEQYGRPVDADPLLRPRPDVIVSGAMRNLAAVGVLIVALVSACGDTGSPTAEIQPANTPGATPDSSQNVNCPASGGPSSGSLTGLGATIGQFRQAHQQDPKYTSQFDGTVSGGPNDGLPALVASCYRSGVVVSVQQNLPLAITEEQAKASVPTLGIAPDDSQFQSAKELGLCELVYFMSASIANDPGANDTAGTFVVELQPPGTVSAFDPKNVTTMIYDLDTSGGC